MTGRDGITNEVGETGTGSRYRDIVFVVNATQIAKSTLCRDWESDILSI